MATMKLRKVGNSLGAILSKDILKKADFAENDELDVTVSRGEITLRKQRSGVTVDLSKEEAAALCAGEFETKAGKSALSKVRKAAK